MSESLERETNMIDIKRVIEMLPHRYPILLIDRVLDYKENESIVALKNVTMNEPHFMGHFPGFPVMPGVLIIEAMAQAAALLVIQSMGSDMEGRLVYFMSIDNARFRKPVTPGDSLHIHADVIKARGNIWKFTAEAKVNGVVHAEATYAAMILDEKIPTA